MLSSMPRNVSHVICERWEEPRAPQDHVERWKTKLEEFQRWYSSMVDDMTIPAP